MSTASSQLVSPGSFAAEDHYYPRVLNAQLHALVRFFLSLDPARIVSRYAHLDPRVDPDALAELLAYVPRNFRWAGSDLMHVTTPGGRRQMVVIETNSCPSGQKSMPLYEEHEEQGGYRTLIERAFAPALAGRRLPTGGLAVLYDKNHTECSGYAAVIADVLREPVHLVRLMDGDPDPAARFTDGLLEVRDAKGSWRPIRAAFRYVTQRPWSRIPVATRTLVFNPVVSCLAGGRNKAVAAKAYDHFNAEMRTAGLQIHTPLTAWDVQREEIPFRVRALGGQAVVKVPYSNAGQGVYTITNARELDAFMSGEHRYGRFIVQGLIGNSRWSSDLPAQGRLFHVGTFPDKKSGQTFATDIRLMVAAGPDGFRPLTMNARRARLPLSDEAPTDVDSWEMLGTNLSVKNPDGSWGTDQQRLVLMDRKDFNSLGLGLDDLVEAYVQTVMSVVAIDKMSTALTSQKGRLKTRLFRSLNDDPALLEEIVSTQATGKAKEAGE